MNAGNPDPQRQRAEAMLADVVPSGRWMVSVPLLTEGKERGLDITLGGGVAFSVYIGEYRNTKDMDRGGPPICPPGYGRRSDWKPDLPRKPRRST